MSYWAAVRCPPRKETVVARRLTDMLGCVMYSAESEDRPAAQPAAGHSASVPWPLGNRRARTKVRPACASPCRSMSLATL